MKIILNALGNASKGPHHHSISPWIGEVTPHGDEGGLMLSGNTYGSEGTPMQWYLGRFSFGEIGRSKKLSLRGKYWVRLEFEDAELKNWIESYIKHKPEEALDLLVEMLPKTVAKLKEKGQ